VREGRGDDGPAALSSHCLFSDLSLDLFSSHRHLLSPPHTHSEDDIIGDLKKLVAAQTGTRPDKIRIQKWHNVFKVSEKRERERGGG